MARRRVASLPFTAVAGLARRKGRLVSDSLIAAIDALTGFASAHQGMPLTPELVRELERLDATFAAHVLEAGLSLPNVPAPTYGGVRLFGGSRLRLVEIWLGADHPDNEGGPQYADYLFLPSVWEDEMRILRARAELKKGDGVSITHDRGGMGQARPAMGTAAAREERIQKMAPAFRRASFAFEYAESKAGKRLKDREAYDLLKEEGIPDDKGDLGELTDYQLPAFDTWTRQLRAARSALGEQKHTARAQRATGKSIVRPDQIEQPERDE